MDRPDPEEVKRVLAMLAAAENRSPGVRSVIEEATDAVCNVQRAATFVDAGGVSRLRLAIEETASSGNTRLARQGLRAMAAIEWFRRAAGSDAEHFRSGHGMDLTVGAKHADR